MIGGDLFLGDVALDFLDFTKITSMKMQMRKFCFFFGGGVFVSAKFPGGGSGSVLRLHAVSRCNPVFQRRFLKPHEEGH